MERTVPSTASEEIELYIRTIYSLLRSTSEVQIRTLEEVHAGMNSSLHPDARKISPDISAFIYSQLRLPDCISEVGTVILGQSATVFALHGYPNVTQWEPVSARARRRKCFYDGKENLACFIASRSDIDDVVPVMTAFQIEWNKINQLLRRCPPDILELAVSGRKGDFSALANGLEMSVDDLRRLQELWGQNFSQKLDQIANHTMNLKILLISGSLSEYWRATRLWWDAIEAANPSILNRPVYFISSNTHSVVNLLTGFALQHEEELVDYIKNLDSKELFLEWESIKEGHVASNRENFLHYVLKKYQAIPEGRHLIEDQQALETKLGIQRVVSEQYFDVEAQVIDLRMINPDMVDPRIKMNGHTFLKNSDALILNIDYPLGLSAYNLLAKVAEHVDPILGVYTMGKSAALNGVRGDVIIPNVVQDEHSQNTYLFQNAFSASDVAPFLLYGTVLDNQKSVSVLGTFLQNSRIMDVIYREGYTDIEMEAGPYLSAIYEMFRPKRHPVNEIVNLYGTPFDIGVLHYVSDTPLSKGKNLGAGTLSYFGMDSTYATTLAILRRIINREQIRCREKNVIAL